MLRPKVPTNPAPTGIVTRTAVVQHTPVPTPVAPAPVTALPSRPTVQLTPGALVALVGGGTAVVLVVGAVLVSMLLAVAITAASLTICSLVIRSLMNAQQQR
ncbi:SpdD-like protein [Streptomyces sp. NPDC051776]|uniref:SpdD-like protein n=1 Tax=Streptomyces sp. NPDC051776 TaxID=3155414 RepID=UPI00343F7D0A